MFQGTTDYLTSLFTGRSSQWPAVRRRWLALHPTCAFCGTVDGVEVHHVVPVHVKPEWELNEANLQTLCRDHHFWCGHLGAWTSYNAKTRDDAAVWLVKIGERP